MPKRNNWYLSTSKVRGGKGLRRYKGIGSKGRSAVHNLPHFNYQQMVCNKMYGPGNWLMGD